jgi:hypothetical protein
MAKPNRYPDNWQKIAFFVKESAGWRSTKCNQQCLLPGKKSGLTKSERLKLTLTVHHRNRIPFDNRERKFSCPLQGLPPFLSQSRAIKCLAGAIVPVS